MRYYYCSFIFLIAFNHLFWSNGYCQRNNEAKNEYDKHSFYFSVGTAVLWHGSSMTYERTLKENLFNKSIISFVKLGTGYYVMWDWSPNYGGPWIFSNYGWLIGKTNHHLEISTGITYTFAGDLRGLLPSGAIGYRYISPKGKYLLRANVAFPEALNLGFGITF